MQSGMFLNLAEVFNIIPRRFIKAYGMKFTRLRHRRQVRGENSPNLHHQIFTARQFIFHEFNINIQILVIKFIDDFTADHRAQFFEIHNKARLRIRFSLDGNDQIEIMPVPVFIRTRAKDLDILFFTPGRIIKLVGRVKMLFP